MCTPAGQEEFFLEFGQRVGARTEAPQALDHDALMETLGKAQSLAPQYKTELLGP